MSLLKATVSIDETNLLRFIRTAVNEMGESLRKEFSDKLQNVLKQSSTANDQFTALVRDVREIKDNYVRLDVIQGHNGAGGGGGLLGGPGLEGDAAAQQKQDLLALKGNVDAHEKTLEQCTNAVSRLRAELTNLTQKVQSVDISMQETSFSASTALSALNAYREADTRSFEALLTFLGLENNETYGGLIRAENHAECPYLYELKVYIEDQIKRITVVESKLKTKIDRSDLDAHSQTISDIRGRVDSAVASLSNHETKVMNAVRAVANDVKDECKGKVGWLELEGWKTSMMEASATTRKVAVDSMQLIERLEKELDALRRTLGPSGHGRPSMSMAGTGGSPFHVSAGNDASSHSLHGGRGDGVGGSTAHLHSHSHSQSMMSPIPGFVPIRNSISGETQLDGLPHRSMSTQTIPPPTEGESAVRRKLAVHSRFAEYAGSGEGTAGASRNSPSTPPLLASTLTEHQSEPPAKKNVTRPQSAVVRRR